MINVDIYVLSMDEVMDFQLDENVQVSQLIREIGQVLCKRTRERLDKSATKFLLCIPARERIIPNELTLAQCGVTNGERLILV